MLLELLGILLSSLAASVWLLYKYTGDVYPQVLKKLLLRTILKNWQSSLPQRLGKYNTLSPKDAEDSGIFPNKEDIALEEPTQLLNEGATDDLVFYGVDDNGNGLVTRVRRHYGDVAEGDVYVTLNSGQSYSASTNGKSVREFAVGTVKLELVEAMRSWRLWFNGIATGTDGSQVHLTVHGIWKPLGEPGDIQQDSNVNLIAEDLSGTGEFGANRLDLQKKLPTGYSQFGATHVWVQIDDQPREELYLYGFRVRRQLGSEEQSGQSAFEIFGMSGEDGNAFRLAAHDGLWTHGDIQHVSGAVHPLNSITASASSFRVGKSIPKFFSISGTLGTYNLEIYKEIASVSVTTSDIV